MGENHTVADTLFEGFVVDNGGKRIKPVGHRLAEQQNIGVQPPLPRNAEVAETVIATLNFIRNDGDAGIFGLFANVLKPSGVERHISPCALDGFEYQARHAGPIDTRLAGRQHTGERIQRLPKRCLL